MREAIIYSGFYFDNFLIYGCAINVRCALYNYVAPDVARKDIKCPLPMPYVRKIVHNYAG